MLKLNNVCKNLGEFNLSNLNLKVKRGEYFMILGKSGAGKSLFLELITGMQHPDKGEIILDEKNITHKKIQKRQVGMVFQDYAIFPHLSVYRNIGYPLKSKGYSKEYQSNTILTVAGQMNLTHLLDRDPGTLSGGELQRVALARVLTLKPKLLLLDEPLVSLDVQLRKDIRTILRKIHQSGQTILHVTHDYEETITLADKVAILQNGQIIQSGTPAEIFHHPKTSFIAEFIGLKNYIPVNLFITEDDICQAKVKGHHNLVLCMLNGKSKGNGHLIISAEDITISLDKMSTSAINNFQGVIKELHPGIKGMEVVVDIGVEMTSIISQRSTKSLDLREGKTVWVSFKASGVRFIGE